MLDLPKFLLLAVEAEVHTTKARVEVQADMFTMLLLYYHQEL
jgi:hypothetical protein